jgi:hypothetical protein
MEVLFKITAGGIATTTPEFFVGFSNRNPTGTDYETFNEQGCFFFASSTVANWQAACKNSTSMLVVDTGFSSSTYPGAYGNGSLQKMRVMLFPDNAQFYMSRPDTPFGRPSAPMQLVAQIWFPSGFESAQAMHPYVRSSTGQRAVARTYALNYFRSWWYVPGE